MKAIAAFLLWIVAASVSAATGDTTSATVLADGWRLAWHIEGATAGGTYSYGLGPSNTLVAPKFVLTYTAHGYDNNGDPRTLTVTNYSGSRARAAVLTGSSEPNVADETSGGGGLTINMALTDFVPAGASDLTLRVEAGLYSSSGATNSAATVAVVNNSAQTYGKTIPNWVQPPFANLTNSTATLELVAFHRSAADGKPVAAVRFIGTDEHSNTVSGVFSNWSVSTGGDAVPFGLLSGQLSLSGLTQGDAIRWDFVAYPWVGDSNAVFDTRQNAFSGITPLPTSLTNLCNRTGGYSGSVALVRTNGSNASGVALTAAQYAANPAALTNAFSTIEGAAEAIAATNALAHSRNDCGASFIRLDAGDHAWTGGTVSGGATTIPKTWVTIMPHGAAGTARITAGSGSGDINDRARFSGIDFNASANVINNCERVLFEDCTLEGSATQFLIQTSGVNVWYVVRGKVKAFAQGLKYGASYNCPPALVRGVTFDGFSGSVQTYACVGNRFTNSPTAQLRMDYQSQPTPIPECAIVYNNHLVGNSLLDDSLKGPSSYGLAWGLAVVQNTFESTTNNTSNLSWNFGSANSISITNSFIAHNTATGRKDFFGYNDTGTNVAWRVLWSLINDYRDDFNLKSFDHGNTEGGGANTNRVGAEALKHGVGFSGWIAGEVLGIGAPISFLPNPFSGLNSIVPSVANSAGYAGFVQRRSYDGSGSSQQGYGDYRTTTNSPLRGLPLRWVLPFDIAGQTRSLGDAAGAYTSEASPAVEPPLKLRVRGVVRLRGNTTHQ